MSLLDENKKDENNSQKVELYINNDKGNLEEDGINLMNVFSLMNKRKKIFLPLIVVFLLLGLIIPVLMYEVKDKEENAIAVIGFEYGGASEGLNPDGTRLDVNYIKSSYIIQNALNNITLSTKPSISAIANNISISGILTNDTQQKLEIINKMIEGDEKYLSQLQTFTLKYRTQYIVTLKNGFANGSKQIKLNDNELNNLLNAITDAYRDYFIETYNDIKLVDNRLASFNEDSHDYLDTLDEVKSFLNYLESYCNSKAASAPWFRASDGLSFNDLANLINTMSDLDIDYIYSYIYLNNVSKNAHSQLTSYKYQLREANLNLAEVNSNITTVKQSIADYKADQIMIASADSTDTTKAEVTSDYYNNLINQEIALNEEKSSLEKQISLLNEKITKLQGEAATEEQVQKAEEYINDSLVNAQDLFNIVNNHANELFESSTYKNSYLEVFQTNTQAESLKDNLKKIIIGAAVGLVLGIVVWCVDGFIIELKKSNKKEENEAINNTKEVSHNA